MKKVLLIFFCSLAILMGKAQNVIIPDATFKNYLLNHNQINTNSDGEIQVSEAQAFIYGIYVNNLGISSLTGIEAFTNITQLDCRNNNLTSLNVSQNTKLEYLWCTYNSITSLNLSANTELNELECSYNNISTLNVSQNTKMRKLDCNINNINSLDISKMDSLEWIQCVDNNIGSLDFSNCTKLGYANMYRNNLTKLDLSNNINLEGFMCFDNNISTITLPATDSLTMINCNNNNISQLDVSMCPKLRFLRAGNNKISTIDLSQNLFLEEFNFSFNDLTDVNVSDNTELSVFHATDNHFTSLDLSHNPKLASIWVENNELEFLDIRNGNNDSIDNVNFNIRYNPNLSCINVDDPQYSAATWVTYTDSQTVFSSECCGSGDMGIIIDSLSPVSCMDSGYVSAHIETDSAIGYTWSTVPPTYDSIARFGNAGIYTLTATDFDTCTVLKSIVVDGPSDMYQIDLYAHLVTSFFRPDFETPVYVKAGNIGCNDTSGTIMVTFYSTNDVISLDSVSYPADSVVPSGDTLFWDYSGLNYLTNYTMPKLYFYTDSTANANDTVFLEIKISPNDGDLDSTDNQRLYIIPVVNSYDPNDKKVYPNGICYNHYTEKDRTLAYTIRFQNTGSSFANRVIIKDSLAPELDINSVRVIGQSHDPMVTEITKNQILSFTFDGINLPDSASDPAGSQGYVIFEATVSPQTKEGTVVHNRSQIYFDFNEPITTNTVFNTMVDQLPEPDTVKLHLDDCDSVSLNGTTYTTTGNYRQELLTYDGCDSILDVDITIGTRFLDQTISACLEYELNGIVYNQSQTVYDTVLAIAGCDSIVTTHLNIKKFNTATHQIDLEQGDSIFVGGMYQTDAGTYYDTIAIAGDCDSIILTVVQLVAGISNEEVAGTNSHFNIYPNPAHHQLYVHVTTDYQYQNSLFEMTLQDLTGRTMLNTTFRADQYVMDLSGLKPGIYFYSIRRKGWLPETGKIVIE